MNGRVDILDNTPVKPFYLTNDNNNLKYYKKNSLKGIQTKSILSDVYFSKDNINQIQNMLRYNVYVRSNKEYIIDRQSDTQLLIIMRSIYLQNSKNLDYNITQQIEELNKLVLDYCVPNVLIQVKQYMQYKESVSKIPKPLPVAISTNNKTNRVYDVSEKLFLGNGLK